MISATAPAPARPASLGAVFAFAWDADAFTATDAMQATGLTRSTTIEVTEELISRGLLRELPNARAAGDYRKGRPARRFALQEDAAVLVGVDAGSEYATARVTDLRSRELATREVALPSEGNDPRIRRERVVGVVHAALAAAGRSDGDVLALAAGVPAPVNRSGLSPRHPTGFWQGMNPDLVHAFPGIPLVRVHNDASLAAIAEGSVGAAVGRRDYIALLADSRMGAGVVVDGHLLHGAHGGVGEMVAFDHVEGVASAHGLGARLEAWAAGRPPLDRTVEVPPRGDGDEEAAAILRRSAAGDPAARDLVEQAGGILARVVSVLGSMFDPQLVVLAGPLSIGADEMIAAARAALPTSLDLPAPDLVASTLGADVVVRGAVAAASSLARAHALDVHAG